MIKPQNVQGIINKFCLTIGMLPTSYKLSLTYEEQILAIGRYLKENVYPAINNNAEALLELQNLYQALKDYVDNYFEDLDVQEEINKKLDAMVQDGTFNEIINQELFAQLNNDITDLKQEDTNINNKINIINGQRTILIGDSYGMYRPALNINGWQVYLQQILGLSDNDCYKLSNSGAGFKRAGDNGTFLQHLTSQTYNISNHNTIKNIIVCGGLNDRIYTVAELETEIENFINYCKTEYPNAQVYIGHIGNSNGLAETNQIERMYCLLRSIPAYQNCTKFGANYLNGVEYIMKDYSNYYDSSHPNDIASMNLAKGIYNAFKTGYCMSSFTRENNIPVTNSIVNGNTLPISYNFFNNNLSIENLTQYTQLIEFTSNQTTDGLIDLGEVDIKYFRNIFPWYPAFSIEAVLILSDNTTVNISAQIFINEGHLYFRFTNPTGTQYILKGIRIRTFSFTLPAIYC